MNTETLFVAPAGKDDFVAFDGEKISGNRVEPIYDGDDARTLNWREHTNTIEKPILNDKAELIDTEKVHQYAPLSWGPALTPLWPAGQITRIGETEKNVSKLAQPAPDRKFREAWRLDGDVIAIDVDLMRPIAVQKVDEWFQAKAGALTAGYTAAEISTWPVRERAERAIKAAAAEQHQIYAIATEANARGITSDALVDLIIAKAGILTTAMANYTGEKAAAHAAIMGATGEAGVNAVLDSLP